MSSGHRRHDGESRAAVLAFLRERDAPMPLAEIAAATGLAPTTVRFHVDHLVAAGAVRTGSESVEGGARPTRPGRPARLYRAVPAVAVEEGAAYRLLAGLLAEELLRAGGTEASLDAGRRWADGILAARSAPAPDPAAVTDAVAALFADGGFAPEVVDADTVALHRCPFIELAREHSAAVCTVHLGLVQGLVDRLGSDRRAQLDVVLDASGPCVVRLGPPRRAA